MKDFWTKHPVGSWFMTKILKFQLVAHFLVRRICCFAAQGSNLFPLKNKHLMNENRFPGDPKAPKKRHDSQSFKLIRMPNDADGSFAEKAAAKQGECWIESSPLCNSGKAYICPSNKH